MNKNLESLPRNIGLYEKFAQDIGVIGITQVVVALRGLVILPVISKTLGASGYGIWTQAMVTLALIAPICELNLSAAVARFLAAAQDKKEIQEGFFSVAFFALGWGCLIALVLFLLRAPIANVLFRDINTTQLVSIIAVIVPFWALNIVGLGFFRAFRLMKTYSIFEISLRAGEVAILAAFVLSGFGISGALMSVLIVYLITDVIMFSVIIFRTGIRLPRFSNLKVYLRFSVPTIPGLLSNWVVSSYDRYVIGFFLRVASVGIYSAGYNIGHIVMLFTAPLGFVLLPTLSKLYDEGNLGAVKTHLTYSVKYLLMIAIPAAFGLSVLAKSLLRILSTPEFVHTGAMVVPFVAVSGLLWGVYVIHSQYFTLVKRTTPMAIMWGTAAALNLGLNIVVVPIIGVLGAAITTLFAYAGVAVATIVMSRQHLKFDVDLVFILKSIFASMAMSLVVWQLNPEGIANVIWVIILAVLIYFVILVLVKGFSKSEIKFFKQLVTRRREDS